MKQNKKYSREILKIFNEERVALMGKKQS